MEQVTIRARGNPRLVAGTEVALRRRRRSAMTKIQRPSNAPGESSARNRIKRQAEKMLGTTEKQFGKGNQWCTEFVADTYQKAGVNRPGWNNPDDWRDVKKFGE